MPEYDGLSVRLNKELLTLEQIDEQAQKLDMNRSKFVILALQMLVNFDVDFWKKIESYSKGLNIPEWAVIQNMITDRFAKEEAQRTVFGKSNSKLDDFMFFNTPNGPVLLTGSEFARIKYDNYVKEFEAKLFQRASVKQKAGKQLTDREQKIVEKFESIVGFEDEYDEDKYVTAEELNSIAWRCKMAFDIYGNRLRRGHCEVHPDIPEPYPCYLCYQEQLEKRHRRAMEEEYRREYEEEMRKLVEMEAQDEA